MVTIYINNLQKMNFKKCSYNSILLIFYFTCQIFASHHLIGNFKIVLKQKILKPQFFERLYQRLKRQHSVKQFYFR